MLQPLSERVELPENVHLRKLKGSLIWHLFKFFLGLMEAALILLIESDAVIKLLDDLGWFLSPNGFRSTMSDVRLAGCDHLVSDL